MDQVAGSVQQDTAILGKPKQIVQVNWKHLVEKPVHWVFDHHLQKSFLHIQGGVGDMKSGWTMFKAPIVEAVLKN